MDYKLKAITNDVDTDQLDLIANSKQNNFDETNDAASSHNCAKNVPVIFSSLQGIHLRTYLTDAMSNNYSITFCDLERWVSLSDIMLTILNY